MTDRGIRDHAAKPQALHFFDGRISRDRRMAAAAETALEGALGGDSRAGVFVVDGKDDGERLGVVGADLESERALADGGKHLFGREYLRGAVEHAEPGKACCREDGGGVCAALDLGDAGVDIPANVRNAQIGAKGEDLGRATRAAGTDGRAGREFLKLDAVASYEGVARVLAR